MPLCPQITNTPVPVVLNGNFTVTNVVPVLAANTEQLEAVKITADNAFTDAAAAEAAAIAASAIAATAVQVSANTIVNASNQLTAINGNGVTVYSGSSPSSGARVVLNSSGLAGFNTGGSPTFAISASSGTVEVTGGILSGGSITGTSINVPTVGSPAFSVNALGAVTASNITINGGQIFMNGGVFSVSSAGALTATSANITGTIQSTNGNIAGWLLSPGTFSNAAADTFLYSNPGTDGLAYSTVGQAIIRRLQLNGSSGTTLGSNVLAVGGNAAVDGTITSIGSIFTNSSLTVDSSATFGNTSANPFLYLASSGTLRSLYTYGVARTSSTRTMIIDSSGNFGTTASTRRKKHEIESYTIDSAALFALDVKTFKYKPEFDPEQQTQHGFIAEEAQALGLDELIQYDSTGEPDYFAYEKLPIFLLQLVQELKAEIDQLKGA